MTKITNDCRGCAAPGYPCLGESYECQHVKHLLCDRCGADVEKLFLIDGEEVCIDCIPGVVQTITL